MTRWEKWLAQQDNGTRADMICNVSRCSKIDCPIWKPCTEQASYDDHEKWAKACEEYLDEEVE